MKTNRPIGCGPALNAAGPLNFALAPPTDMRTNVAAKLTTGRDGKANSALELEKGGLYAPNCFIHRHCGCGSYQDPYGQYAPQGRFQSTGLPPSLFRYHAPSVRYFHS
mgnify:CR=1 FL=1